MCIKTWPNCLTDSHGKILIWKPAPAVCKTRQNRHWSVRTTNLQIALVRLKRYWSVRTTNLQTALARFLLTANLYTNRTVKAVHNGLTVKTTHHDIYNYVLYYDNTHICLLEMITVNSRYNTVIFLKNSHNRCSISRPWSSVPNAPEKVVRQQDWQV